MILALSSVKIPTNRFGRYFIFGNLKKVKTVKLSKEIIEILKSNAIKSLKAVAVSQNLTFGDKIIFLKIKLKSLLKYPLSTSDKRFQLILALLLFLSFLWLNGTKAYVAFLFSLSKISTNLLYELKGTNFDFDCDQCPLNIDEMFDEALVKFEDIICLEVIDDVDGDVLVEIFKYYPSELEDIVLK